jgi:hypothetical protein
MDVMEAARLYAGLGWFVLPVLGKVPNFGEAWQDKTTNDPEQAVRAFALWEHDGIGVQLGPKSGIIDIECDDEEAEDLFFELMEGLVPQTPTFASTRGTHHLFKWEPGLPVEAKPVFKIGALEFRTGNGEKAAQTVFPPSGSRTWVVAPQTPVLEIPRRFLEAVRARHAEIISRKAFKSAGLSFPRYGDGETLDVPRWLEKHGKDIIGRAEGDGITRWFIECPGVDKHTNRDGWRDCCITQEPSGKLGGHCFHQSCGMGDWQSLKNAIGGLDYDDYHEPEPPGEPVDLSGFCVAPAAEPPLAFRCPGLLGEIVDYTLRTSRYPQPALAVAGALALFSVVTGRKVEDEFGTRTNLFSMGVCPPAGGKDRSRQVNKEILLLAGGEPLIGPESLGSSAGLISVVDDQPATLFQLDEIGKLFAIMQNKNAGHLYNIGREFLKLYSSSGSLYIGDAYADRKKIKKIYQPHAVVYGTSTPESFWGSLSSDNVSDGLVGRFLVFDSGDYVLPTPRPREPVPANIIERIRWWLDYKPTPGNLAPSGVHPISVPFGPGAAERLQGQELKIAQRRQDEDSTTAAVWSRTSEKSYKLALLFACARADLRPPGVIAFEDADLAVRITNYLTRQMLRKVVDHVSDNEHEAKLKKVLRKIGQEIQKNNFTRATQFLRDGRERSEILRTLQEAGYVRIETRQTRGRSAEWIVKVVSFDVSGRMTDEETEAANVNDLSR